MPAYAYTAIDSQGKELNGMIEADSPRAARTALRARALLPMNVEVVNEQAAPSGHWLQREVWAARAYSNAGLAVFTRQLSGLVSAGLPIERALTVLAEEAENPRQQRVIAALRAEVNGGASLAKALAQAPREFSDTYRAVIAAGEQGGALDRVLESLASDLEEGLALRAKLLGAALYPAIVSAVALAIVIFLLGYVVPQVAEVFIGSRRALPALTVMMLALSEAVRNWGWWALLVLVGLALVLRQALQNEALRISFDALWLRLPLIGRLARGYNAARFAATLAMLAQAGVPILRALQAATDTLHNRAMKRDAQEALVQVREGAPLAAALAAHRRFPTLLTMFARLGEQTGTLPAMLQRAAAQLGGEVQRRAMQMATILEPLLIVAMGGVVMLIVLAVLLPIIELNQLAR
ncbi:MAG: type II secretion system inner membrane protein GspF [Betaproteobacteria bacterium]